MAYGVLSFPDTGCPVLDVYIYYVFDMINVWDTVSTFIHPHGCFRSRTFFYEQRIG